MTKKIMFNDAFCLTRAVLNGRKTMTRRILKEGTPLGNWKETERHLPYKVGEVIAVAESYKNIIEYMAEYSDIIIDVDGSINRGYKAGWANKMFVRADLMPHHIRIADIKVECLQDISDDECLKEGLRLSGNGRFYYQQMVASNHFINKYFDTPREAFADLIDKISGKGTWESNPLVAAYSLELVYLKRV